MWLLLFWGEEMREVQDERRRELMAVVLDEEGWVGKKQERNGMSTGADKMEY